MSYGQCSTSDFFSNAHFNFNACCPYTYSMLNCAQDWVQATPATSDYFACGFHMPGAPASVRINTSGYVGGYIVRDYTASGSGSADYEEYIGRCLNQPMLAGQVYTFTINIASFPLDSWGMNCGSIWYGASDITFFGSGQICPSIGGTLRFPTVSPVATDPWRCPVGVLDWHEIGSATYSPSSNWTQMTITLRPTVNIYRIMFGGECDPPVSYRPNGTCLPYFVYDDIRLTVQCSDNNPCTDDLCINGVCQYPPKSCNDNIPCTLDVCITAP